MVTLPVLRSDRVNTSNIRAALTAIAVDTLLDSLTDRADAFFLDIEQGANPAGAFLFRLTNGANDTANFFRGIELQPSPTLEEIKASPGAHLARMVIGTNVDIDRAILEMPEAEGEIRRGVENARANGLALSQAVANAANADRDVEAELERNLIARRESLAAVAREAGVEAVARAPDVIKPWLQGFADYVEAALFAQPRKSGDGKRVSMEAHEYRYLKQPISTYSEFGDDVSPGEPVSHIGFAMNLLFQRLDQNTESAGGNIIPGVDINSIPRLGSFFSEGMFFDASTFAADTFTYGDFVDSPNFRKLLARLKNLVQSTRLANVKSILRQTNGQGRGQFILDATDKWPAQDLVAAAEEVLLATHGNVENPGITAGADEILQPAGDGDASSQN